MKSIGLKITLIMLCVIILGILATVGTATFLSGTTIIRESESMVQSETASQAHYMNEWLSNHKSIINSAATVIAQVDNHSDEHLRGMLKSLLDLDSVYQDVFIGFPDNTAVMGSGYPVEELYDWWRATERDWYRAAMVDTDKVGVTDLYVDANTKDLVITIVKAIKQDSNVVGVLGIDIHVNYLQDVVFAADVGGNGYSMLLDSNANILIHPDSEYAPDNEGNYKNMAIVNDGNFANLWRLISSSDDIYKYTDAYGVTKYYTSSTLDATGWHMVTIIPTSVVTKPIVDVIIIIIPITVVILLIAAAVIHIMTKSQISAPLTPATAFFKKAGHTGDLSLTQEDISTITKYSMRKDEVGQLIAAAAAFVGRLTEVSEALEGVAGGDLDIDITPQSENDKLGMSMQKMTENLNNMFKEINSSSTQVSVGSKQVADGAQTLAQGSTQQAAAIQELSHSISEIAEETKTNTTLAEKAANLAETIKDTAQKGSSHMGDMMTAVNDINDASGSISKVIKVIDDIAFQTNILALNAAVEAARAGQHGKGFAVVAEEVRNLAAKSAEAAKDTSSLIENSIEKATFGVRIAGETADSLSEIVTGINESSQLVSKIAKSSEEQAVGIAQVNIGIDQVAQVVQQNSATAEESAAASQQMNAQSAILQDLISQFKLKGDNSEYASLPPPSDL